MNDNQLHELLRQADEQFQDSTILGSANAGIQPLVEEVRRRRLQQSRQRVRLFVSVVVLVATGLSAWSMTANVWNGRGEFVDQVAANSAKGVNDAPTSETARVLAQGRRSRDKEIARLKAEIAALDAEARSTHQLVQLYQAAESRNNRLVAAEMASAEPLLPQQALAELEIDRAAAITVLSADAQAALSDRMAEATESYRSVIKHFPDSRWASIAQQRLAQTQHMN